MSIAELNLADFLGLIVGFTLTLGVFSYIFGDNFLFRIVLHIFIGVAAGYAAVMVSYNVIWYQLVAPLLFGSQAERFLLIIPLVLSTLLLMKVSPRLSGLGNPAMAYLVGVGAAAAIGGAVMGTIIPQVAATTDLFGFEKNLINGSIMLVGIIATLVYFHFSARSRPGRFSQRSPWIEGIAAVGQGFIAVAFGAIFAGVYAASLAALIERLDFLVKFLLSFFLPS